MSSVENVTFNQLSNATQFEIVGFITLSLGLSFLSLVSLFKAFRMSLYHVYHQ